MPSAIIVSEKARRLYYHSIVTDHLELEAERSRGRSQLEKLKGGRVDIHIFKLSIGAQSQGRLHILFSFPYRSQVFSG